jgi:hypothetical protein
LATEPPKTPVSSSKAAERDAAQQDGFLREVDEALREEQMVGAIKRFAKPVGGAIVALLLAVGGYLAWDYSVKSEATKRSEAAVLAFDKLEAGQLDAAAKDLQPLLSDGSPASKAAAAMNLAAIALAQGKEDEAAKRFAVIAADALAPKPFRDLAAIREVTIRFDAMKSEDVIARMKPLAVPGSAFFGSAGELLGMAYLDQGKPELAGPLFAQIGKDKTVPETLRGRAKQMSSSLGYDGGVDIPSEAPELAGAPAGASAAAPTPKQ